MQEFATSERVQCGHICDVICVYFFPSIEIAFFRIIVQSNPYNIKDNLTAAVEWENVSKFASSGWTCHGLRTHSHCTDNIAC